jgi:Ni/Fe-hydrogenase subunit HybB-like protein
MNREQKKAWAIVSSMSLAAVLCVVALISRHLGLGLLTVPLFVAAGVVQGTGVLVCLRIKPDKGAVTSDERDKQIERNAHLAGFGAVYLFVIVASFAPIAVLGEQGSLPVTWCPVLLICAGFCQAYAMSVSVLIQSGRSGKGEQE